MVRKLSSRNKERMGIYFFILLFMFLTIRIWAQGENDTIKIAKPEAKSPIGAVVRSALIPGWGQWYNEQKLKAVFVLAGEVALAGNAVYYNQMAVKSTTFDEREFYCDVRSRFIWWFAGIYLLNLLDAYVDAHLWDFDTGPDLSMKEKDRTIWITIVLK